MNKKSKLRKYEALFRKKIGLFLAPGISIKTVIFPVENEGAVFEFLLNRENENTSIFENQSISVGKVLEKIPQRFFAGNTDGVSFKGTSLYLEGNRILVIKGDDETDSWSGPAVLDDVMRVVSTSQGSRS